MKSSAQLLAGVAPSKKKNPAGVSFACSDLVLEDFKVSYHNTGVISTTSILKLTLLNFFLTFLFDHSSFQKIKKLSYILSKFVSSLKKFEQIF
jgi:hypothetical protein